MRIAQVRPHVRTRVLLLDGFGTVLDWSGPFREVNENALRRALASVDGLARVPPFAAWHPHWVALRNEERAAKDPTHEERDYVERFRASFARVGLAKRQARVLGEKAADRYFRELESAMRLAPDATPEFWRALPDGLKLVLVSNYGHAESLKRALDRLGVYYRFDAIVVSADVGWLKPHRAMFETALKEAGAEPGECLMVGDDPERDVEGAHALGIRAALAANPRPGLRDLAERDVRDDMPPAIAVVRDLREIAKLL